MCKAKTNFLKNFKKINDPDILGTSIPQKRDYFYMTSFQAINYQAIQIS